MSEKKEHVKKLTEEQQKLVDECLNDFLPQLKTVKKWNRALTGEEVEEEFRKSAHSKKQ